MLDTDFQELMAILSVPRPNGSVTERKTSQDLQRWLQKHNIPYHIHSFRQYPYLFETTGIWLILSRTLLALAVWLRWGWGSLPIAVLGLLGGTLDIALHLPLVSWPGARRAENIVVEFTPPDPKQELILSAHYDSKTELLDHHQRMFFLKNLRLGIVITLILGLIGPLESWLRSQGSIWTALIYWIGAVLALALIILAWGLGLNLSTGRLLRPSQGAVDNGAACAILLGLAESLNTEGIISGMQSGSAQENIFASIASKPEKQEQFPLQNLKLTLALFSGEEINMQGSRAYVRDRDWPLPAGALNLEVMSQDGDYVFWELDGNVFHLAPTSAQINKAIRSAVTTITGVDARPAGPVNSDGASFLSAGIPTSVIGTYDLNWVDTGFHRPSDNLQRIVMKRLPEGVKILTDILYQFEREESSPFFRKISP